MPTRTLRLTLHRQWFRDILAGTKVEEYRDIKPHWTRRLMELGPYDAVLFRNGYEADVPEMLVRCHGIQVKDIVHPVTGQPATVYAIALGEIVATRNCTTVMEPTRKEARRSHRGRPGDTTAPPLSTPNTHTTCPDLFTAP